MIRVSNFEKGCVYDDVDEIRGVYGKAGSNPSADLVACFVIKI